jgi:hypothetical protein
MQVGGLPQQRVSFDRSKVFRVRASMRATIRVHCGYYPSLFAQLSTEISQKDYINPFFSLLRIIFV